MSATIHKYELVEANNVEQGYEYDTLDEAIHDAVKYGMAVIEIEYEWADSSLMWTPNGSNTWPPEE